MEYKLTTACELYYLLDEKEVKLLESLGFTMKELQSTNSNIANLWYRQEETVGIEINSLDDLVELEISFRESVKESSYGGIIINDDLIKVYDGYIE